MALAYGPYTGRNVHFKHVAPEPEPKAYAVNRYDLEAWRALKAAHTFKSEMDAEAARAMFPRNERPKA